MSVDSAFRIPASQLGKAKDQTAASALTNYGCRAYWPWGGSVKPDGRMGISYELSSFPIWYAQDAAGRKIRVFRNPANQDSPAYWQTIKEFQALPKTIPQYNWFPPAQWYNNWMAGRQDAYNDTRRYLELPWGQNWRTPKGTTDHGILIDDDETGVTGYETLGLRIANPADRLTINLRAGKDVIFEGDWIFDGAARRTADNVGKYEGRGMGKIPKRVGLLTADDMLNGWDEAKVLVVPNVQFGTGATFVKPATRYEHKTKANRYKDHPTDTYPEGNDPRMIPHGTAFVGNLSSAKMEAIVDANGFQGEAKKAAIKNLQGLCEFGVKVGETGSSENLVESEGAANPKTKAKLDSMGIGASEAGRMFRGVFVPGNFYVANPTP